MSQHSEKSGSLSIHLIRTKTTSHLQFAENPAEIAMEVQRNTEYTMVVVKVQVYTTISFVTMFFASVLVVASEAQGKLYQSLFLENSFERKDTRAKTLKRFTTTTYKERTDALIYRYMTA